jgi:PIN domain nuclease of toxin-antitoxin system
MSDNLLIDTHIFLWLAFSPEKLSDTTLHHLQDKRNQVSISVISFWEISLKYQLGKLSLSGVLPDALLDAAKDMGIEVADIAPSEFATFFKIPSMDNHKDPFDRLIIWQCISQGRTLVSYDSHLESYIELGLRVLK